MSIGGDLGPSLGMMVGPSRTRGNDTYRGIKDAGFILRCSIWGRAYAHGRAHGLGRPALPVLGLPNARLVRPGGARSSMADFIQTVISVRSHEAYRT